MTNEDKKEKKDGVGPSGHLTSIITSDEKGIELDSLSREIKTIRREIIQLNSSNTEKLERLLMGFDRMLTENCARVKKDYADSGCPNVDVQSAIGYFIPNVNERDAILRGAEPSVIVTANDLTEDGLNRFLEAAGVIGENYYQDAEILKFPISDERFDHYVNLKAKESNVNELIGSVTDDNIIPTFEIVVNLPELLGGASAMSLNENYLKNTAFYASIIMDLANHQYVASTWPIRGGRFSTIFIRGWDGSERGFEAWHDGLKGVLNRISTKSSRSLEGGTGMVKGESTKADRSPLQRYSSINELLIIPQSTIESPSCGSLTYADLRREKERSKIVRKLLEIL